MNIDRLTRLEDFPDEIFLLICRYLNIFEILHSFTCLNSRLSQTINEFSFTIDLNSIPLRLINCFINQIFPNICSNVRRLVFPDDFERFPIDLSIFANLKSIHFLNKFPLNFPSKIEEIEIDLVPVDLQMILLEKLFSSNDYSNLHSLSLTSYHGFTFSNIQLFHLTQIKSLTINLKNNIDLFQLLSLFSSSIEYLNIHILYNGSFQSLFPLKLIKLRYFHLKTTFEDSIQFEQLERFLIQSFQSMKYLSIETLTRDQNYINGYQWENLLKQFIDLQTFVCSIRYRFRIDQTIDQQTREINLFNSFSTHFWLNEKQWFIQFYTTISISDQTCFYKKTNYGKLFLHTIPYPYAFLDATFDINKAKSTINQDKISRNIYSNVRHLYYDGESIPISIDDLKNILNQFRFLKELKLDRLIIDSSKSINLINLRYLNKLIIYNNDQNNSLNTIFFNFSSIYNLRYIRIPQILLTEYIQMPQQLQTLILTDCRDWNLEFIEQYQDLRILKLFLNNFDRLLENNGELINYLIKSIYKTNPTMESLQLMCPGINQTKMKIFQKEFNSNRIDYLNANYDGKCLSIERMILFYQQNK